MWNIWCGLLASTPENQSQDLSGCKTRSRHQLKQSQLLSCVDLDVIMRAGTLLAPKYVLSWLHLCPSTTEMCVSSRSDAEGGGFHHLCWNVKKNGVNVISEPETSHKCFQVNKTKHLEVYPATNNCRNGSIGAWIPSSIKKTEKQKNSKRFMKFQLIPKHFLNQVMGEKKSKTSRCGLE